MAIRATGVAASQQLISQLVLEAQSVTKDYIRAEGDFHKEIPIYFFVVVFLKGSIRQK